MKDLVRPRAAAWRRGLGFVTLLVFTLALAGCFGDDGDDSSSPKLNPGEQAGDDTYVPDFQAGNLSFTDVWVPDVAQAGFPMDVWFDVTAEEPKYNVYVKLDLVRLDSGNASDLVIDPDNYSPDYQITAVVIEDLAKGETRHVAHSFVVPPDVADATYAAVFTVNQYDFYPEDDALQGEEAGDDADNFVVAPASIIIGTPDKPNLRILSQELVNHSFELPALAPVDEDPFAPAEPAFILNAEVEAMAQDAVDPVLVEVELDVGAETFPLWVALENGGEDANQDLAADAKVKAPGLVYPTTCRDADGNPVDAEVEGARCASLFRQEQVGYTYQLSLNEAAYEALAQRTEDTTCTLRILIDRDGVIDEWEANTSDNVKELAVVFLPAVDSDEAPRVAPRALEKGYDTSLLSQWKEDSAGNDNFGAGYKFGGEMNYRTFTLGDATLPGAGYFGSDNNVWVRIFGSKFYITELNAELDVDIDDIPSSYFDYGFYVVGARIWGNYYGLTRNEDGEIEPLELWSTEDEDGNERFSVSKEMTKEKTFWVGPIPVAVTGGASGEIGIRGKVLIEAENVVAVEMGPYASLTGIAKGGIGVSGIASAGVGVDLLLIEVYQKLRPSLQLLPTVPMAAFRFEAPLVISTLDGTFYLYAETFWDDYQLDLIDWEGLSWDYHWMQPYEIVWRGGTVIDEFVVEADVASLQADVLDLGPGTSGDSWLQVSGFGDAGTTLTLWDGCDTWTLPEGAQDVVYKRTCDAATPVQARFMPDLVIRYWDFFGFRIPYWAYSSGASSYVITLSNEDPS